MRKLALLGLALVACSDSGGPGSSVMTALVNGASFTAQNPPDHQIGLLDTTSNALTVLGIQQVAPMSFRTLAVSIRGFHGIGHYTTCGGVVFGTYFQVDQADSTRVEPFYTTDTTCGGQVDVGAYEPAFSTISGTFHFTATSFFAPDTVHVTDGRFDGRFAISDIVIGALP